MTESASSRNSPGGWCNHRGLLLGALFLIALSVRLVYLWDQAQNNPLFKHPIMDGRVHHEWAANIASGNGMSAEPYFRAPLYYYTLAGLYKLTGPNVAAGRVAGSILGAVTCALIGLLGTKIGAVRVGWLAGMIAAFYWPFIYFDGEILTVGLEIFLDVLLLLLLIDGARRRSLALIAAAGLAFGLSAITRPNVLALGPLCLIWLWVMCRHVGNRRWLLQSAAFVGCAATVIAPVTFRNRLVGGEWVLIASQGGVNFFIGNNPQSDGYTAVVPGTRPEWWAGFIDTHRIPEEELGRTLTSGEVSDYWFAKSWAWIKSSPGAWLKLMILKFRLFWSPVEVPNNQPDWYFASLSRISVIFWIGFPVVACLAFASLPLLRIRSGEWGLLLSFAGAYMATVVAFFCPGRYRLPIVPVLIVAAAAGLTHLAGSVRARQVKPIGFSALALLFAVIFLASNPPDRPTLSRLSEAEAHYILGQQYSGAEGDETADKARAAEEFQSAVRLRPDDADMRMAWGQMLGVLGKQREAAEQFQTAAKLRPDYAKARYAFGAFLAGAQRLEPAAVELKAAIAIQRSFVEARNKLAEVLYLSGQDEEAAASLRETLQIAPTSLLARYWLAMVLTRQGKSAEASAYLDEVAAGSATNAGTLQNIGIAFETLKRHDRAIDCFRQVVLLDPARPAGYTNLSLALRRAGRFAESIAALRSGLARLPNDARLMAALARVLATCPVNSVRNGAEAVMLAEQAAGLTKPPTAYVLDTLAAAYAEMGKFDRAVSSAGQAVEAARKANQSELANLAEQHLQLYREGKPLRQADGE